MHRCVRHVPQRGVRTEGQLAQRLLLRAFTCNLANFRRNPVQPEGIKQRLLTTLRQRRVEGRAKVFRPAGVTIVIGKVELV